ncbi:helix-turn-helix transcriptional regulator [Actinomarinicola tropica]|uniref:LuxR family transcriptional regulator n=1 Tax=Actinomarinicola tropica TaxID=2789776 RepID=A0A5Q2RE72_9ACTN|nr:helix-turn-helix transcriptional regulator [Actinomarinicola tropica]QGG93923.1 LuxR family transcriptional regulator [Actinomarinicola tropica]
MPTSRLTAERVRGDIDVLARAGLDVDTFLVEAMSSLGRAIPHAASCVLVVDPATQICTATFKYGQLEADNERDAEWGKIEYSGGDETSFINLFDAGLDAVAVSHATGGDIARSIRMREFLTPFYEFHDELRIVARTGGRTWGGICLHRSDEAPYEPEEVAFATAISPMLAVGLRSGLLARCATTVTGIDAAGPAVIIVDEHDELSQVSVGADVWLDELAACDNSSNPITTIVALVAGARRYARRETTILPRCRVRLRSGRWLVLHASPLAGPGATGGQVVVTMEEARPPEIVPLVVSAFQLTPRERDVAQLVLQGVETKDIAAQLHMSVYTVQDHLKSVFEKSGVRSRRELTARVFFDQYVPRMGAELAPSGWFVDEPVA